MRGESATNSAGSSGGGRKSFMSVRTLLVLSLSSVWERGVFFPRFSLGEVNRAAEHWEYPSGKATNLCRAVKCLRDPEVQTILLTTVGGPRGQRFQEACRDEGLFFHGIPCRGETRVCTNVLVAGHSMTEMVEEAPALYPEEQEKFLAALEQVLPDADGVALAGNFPPETPEEFPRRIAQLVAKQALPLFLDNWRHFAVMAQECPKRLTLKINAEELRKITGIQEIPQAMEELCRKYPGLTLGVTDGAADGWLLFPEMEHPEAFPIPHVKNPVNTLGAGDTASGVFFAQLLEGKTAKDAFQNALQDASKSCLTRIAGEFES